MRRALLHGNSSASTVLVLVSFSVTKGFHARNLRMVESQAALLLSMRLAVDPIGVRSNENPRVTSRALRDAGLFNPGRSSRLRARAPKRQQSRIRIRRWSGERGGREHNFLQSRRYDEAARNAGGARLECNLRLGAFLEPRHNVAGRPGLPDHGR